MYAENSEKKARATKARTVQISGKTRTTDGVVNSFDSKLKDRHLSGPAE